jgi:cytochrome P450
MTSMALDNAPRLAGAVPAPGRYSFAERRRQRRERPIGGVPDRAYDEPMVLARMITGQFLLVNDPAAVRRVLAENVANYPKTAMEYRFFRAIFGAGLLGIDGELWRAHRRIMAPAFDPRSVASYAPAVSSAAEAHAARWNELPAATEVDMAREMADVTLHIISRTVFSADDPELLAAIRGSLSGGTNSIGDINLLDVLPLTKELMMRRRERRIARVFAPLDAMVARLMAARAAAPSDAPADLLGRLMAASEDGGALSAREVRDEVVTIFVAGHETTAMTMSWTWYLLSQHPDWAARLHAELDVALGGRPATQDDLPNLPLTRRVVEESMRLYPAAPGLSTRRVVEDDELAGVSVRKGMNIVLLPWVLHRHRRLWDEPERFDPDRFLPVRSAGRHRFAYMPFGGGPRVCIGQLLAVNESILLLASLAQHFNPRLAPRARVALRHNVTLQPKHGLPMILERRG